MSPYELSEQHRRDHVQADEADALVLHPVALEDRGDAGDQVRIDLDVRDAFWRLVAPGEASRLRRDIRPYPE
jgi:hypothetical protein